MIILLLAIVVSTIMTCVFRYTEPRGYNGNNIQTVNYIFCVIVSFLLAWRSGSIALLSELKNVDFSILFTEKTIPNSVFLALVIGCCTGFLYVEILTAARLSYEPNGTSITIMFEKIMFICPILLSMVAWGEVPTVLQIVGIVFALAAIIVSSTGEGLKALKAPGYLFLAAAGAAFNLINSKLLVALTFNSEVKSLYVFVVFFVALLFNAWYVSSVNKKAGTKFKPTRREIIAGLLAGAPNLGYSYLLLITLGLLPAAIVYPSTSAGNLFVITVASRVFFKEKITKRQYLALGLTLAGLILVNI